MLYPVISLIDPWSEDSVVPKTLVSYLSLLFLNFKKNPLLTLLFLLPLPDLPLPERSQDHEAPGSSGSLCSQGKPVGEL